MKDVLIVGGGPVGLVTAIAAASSGMKVCVLDRRVPGQDHLGLTSLDKACGEGLMSPALTVLKGLGVCIDPEGARPLLGIRYIDGATVAEAPFIDGEGLGVRRVYLHNALMERARELGVELRWGVRVDALLDGGVQTNRGPQLGRWVVGADGLKGRVRRWAGLETEPRPWNLRYGIRKHFVVAPWTDFVEVYWHEWGEAYVTPVGRRRVGIAFLCNDKIRSFDDMLRCFPALAERLAGAPSDSRTMGAGPFRHQPRAVQRGNLALVGDASGYMDAITGEGLSLGFRQALALVSAMQAGDLRLYEREHRRLGRIPIMMMAMLLETARHPRLRSRLIRALAHEPRLWSKILAVGHGAEHFTYVKPWELAWIGLRILLDR